MVALDVTETSKSLAVAGGYVSIFGVFSYFVKEKLFMSEALIALLVGIITGPIALRWFDPFSWSEDQDYLTHQITRVVIAIQVLFTGIALPARYLKREWLSLVTLLGPIMTTAWFVSSLSIWGLIPGLTFLESLVIGACVTPTDPVLSNAICKGRYAEKNVPLHVRNIIVAEAGANDGLGFPFLFLALYLILIHEPDHPRHSIGGAIGEWFYNILFYQIILSCLIGAGVGYIARKLLKFAKQRQLIDHESFLSFGVALTFFTLGWVGIIGSDDILCCFVVGNSFTWDDWFRLETEDHGFQDVIDQLLNSGIFLYIGAIIPWSDFSKYSLSPWRLVVLGILIMLVRRLPWVWALSRWIPALKTTRESVFAGFFGPIGVGAVFYVQVALDVIPDDGTREHLRQVILPVVYFLVLTSVVVHGITIPIGKGGFKLARTMTLSGSKSLSRNATGNVDGGSGGGVSRLPPPVNLPSRPPSIHGLEIGTLQDRKPNYPFGQPANTNGDYEPDRIRFGDAPTSVSNNNEKRTIAGILSRRNSSENVAEEGLQGNRDGNEINPDNLGSNEHGSSRIWVEGHDLVEESEDGEDVRVVRREENGRPMNG